MSEFFDSLERRSREERAADHLARLHSQLKHAKTHAPYFKELLKGIAPEDIAGLDDLRKIPVTRKTDLMDLQSPGAPFGGMNATAVRDLAKIFLSPGPIADAEGRRQDAWRFARAMFAAGFRQGEIVHNCFSYHLTPAGSIVETGAAALGCPVFPGGVGNTEQQLEAMERFRPQCYAGTPSFLKIIVDKALEKGLPMTFRKALVSGEPFFPDVRQALSDAGCETLQAFASADLGLIAYESAAKEGMIVDEQVIVEIVRPGTDDPVPEGEVGEIVVTTFNPDYPLIRFGTGDMSAVLPGESPCGRTNLRIKGWMGRADQSTKVKGMFVHPRQINEVLKRHPSVVKARLTVAQQDGKDVMTLACETATPSDDLRISIEESVQSITKLRGTVAFATPGELQNDGKVIDDVRG
ncbi:MAG: AMP-binding protein [Alphaproteobacteria bacterium]|nr:AMP-binding protein [Alphaproteobacteria bacterium]